MPAASAPNSVIKASGRSGSRKLTTSLPPPPSAWNMLAAFVEHVGGLRHSRNEIAVGNYYWRVCRVSIGKELDGGCIGILGGPELNGIIGALGGDAVSVRDLFECRDVGTEGKSPIFVAD